VPIQQTIGQVAIEFIGESKDFLAELARVEVQTAKSATIIAESFANAVVSAGGAVVSSAKSVSETIQEIAAGPKMVAEGIWQITEAGKNFAETGMTVVKVAGVVWTAYKIGLPVLGAMSVAWRGLTAGLLLAKDAGLLVAQGVKVGLAAAFTPLGASLIVATAAFKVYSGVLDSVARSQAEVNLGLDTTDYQAAARQYTKLAVELETFRVRGTLGFSDFRKSVQEDAEGAFKSMGRFMSGVADWLGAQLPGQLGASLQAWRNYYREIDSAAKAALFEQKNKTAAALSAQQEMVTDAQRASAQAARIREEAIAATDRLGRNRTGTVDDRADLTQALKDAQQEMTDQRDTLLELQEDALRKESQSPANIAKKTLLDQEMINLSLQRKRLREDQSEFERRLDVEDKNFSIAVEREKIAERSKWTELSSRASADRLNLAEMTVIQEISMARQVAEARKASEAEMLAFDKQTLDTRLKFDGLRRDSRMRAIDDELAMLRKTEPEELKIALTLQEEKGRLLQEGLNTRAKYEVDILALAQKSAEAQIRIDEATFEARRTLGDASLQDEIDHAQRRARLLTAGTPERIKAEAEAIKFAQDLQVKALDDAFRALKTRGEASLKQELDYLKRRAGLFKAGSAERTQAEAEAAKFSEDMADRLFAHERALGIRSLEDEIARIKAKVAATLAGTEARMKAEEALFQLEQELNRRRQQAADGGASRSGTSSGGLGTFGEETVAALTPEQRGEKFPGDWNQTLKDLFAVGREDLVQKLFDKFGPTGNLNDVFAMQVAAHGMPSPILSPELQQTFGGEPIASPLAGMGAGTRTEMETMFEGLDSGLTKMEQRVEESGSRIRTTLFNNLEGWFIDKLMEQGGRN